MCTTNSYNPSPAWKNFAITKPEDIALVDKFFLRITLGPRIFNLNFLQLCSIFEILLRDKFTRYLSRHVYFQGNVFYQQWFANTCWMLQCLLRIYDPFHRDIACPAFPSLSETTSDSLSPFRHLHGSLPPTTFQDLNDDFKLVNRPLLTTTRMRMCLSSFSNDSDRFHRFMVCIMVINAESGTGQLLSNSSQSYKWFETSAFMLSRFLPEWYH